MEISYIYSRDNTGVREFDNLALLECAHEICEAGGESPHCGFAILRSVVEFIEASDRCFGIPLVHHAWAWGYDEVRVNYSDAHLEININLVDRVMRDVEHNSIILTHESIDNKQKKEV